MPHTIILKDEGRSFRKEGEAGEAITPGDLIEFGGSADVRKHATIGGPARRAFAVENDLIGKGIDDDYASGDLVQYIIAPPGAEIYARASEAVSKGEFLESAGTGQLQVASTSVESSNVAVALETTSGPGRVKVEVL